MFCPKCGNEMAEGMAFCPKCGAKIDAAEENAPPKEGAADNCGTQESTVEKKEVMGTPRKKEKLSKYKKAGSIVITALGAILLLESLASDYDWTLAPFVLGIGICASGILQLLKKSPKVTAIVQMVLGAIAMLISLELSFDCEYVGFVAGAGLLVCGILKLLKKSNRISSIVEIVFGGVSALLGIAFIDWVWGDTGLLCGAAFLVEGILNLIDGKKR